MELVFCDLPSCRFMDCLCGTINVLLLFFGSESVHPVDLVFFFYEETQSFLPVIKFVTNWFIELVSIL